MIDRNLYSACLLILTFKHTPETPENENYVSEFKDLRKRCRLHLYVVQRRSPGDMGACPPVVAGN